MLIPCLRKTFSPITNLTGSFIGKSRLSPDIFTMMSLLWASASAVMVAGHSYLWGSLFVLISGAWDGIDGSVARCQNRVTGFGNYLDAIIDKYVEAIICAGFVFGGYAAEAFFVISGSLILSYAKPRTAIVISIDNHDWPAMGDRADRFVLIILTLLLGKFIPGINLASKHLSTVSIMLCVTAAIIYAGSIQRVLYAKKLIKPD